MAIRSNTTGYLSRATDLPVDSTGWTTTQWFMMVAQDATNFRTLFTVEGASPYFAGIGIPAGTSDLIWEHDAGSGYSSQTLLTVTAGTWYFAAIRMISATQVELLWRAFGASSLSSSGVLTITSTTWTAASWLSYTGGPAAPNVHNHSAKLWHAALNSTEILAESLQGPPVRTANIDSYMTWRDATDPGDDESGNNRDWTASGTFATVDYVPALMSLITAGGTAFALTANSGVSADLPLATATGTAHAPSAVATQPASLPLATAAGVAHAPSAAATQPSSLPLATATGTAHAPQAGGAMLPTATAVAEAHAPTADDGSPPVRQLPMSRGRGAGRRFGAV